MIDVSEARLAEADAAGAAWTATPAGAAERAGAADLVFVTAGAPGAVELAVELADDGGDRGALRRVPEGTSDADQPRRDPPSRLAIIGVYSQEPADWRASAGYLRSGTLASDLDSLVTARFGLDDVSRAFELATNTPVYRVLVGR